MHHNIEAFLSVRCSTWVFQFNHQGISEMLILTPPKPFIKLREENHPTIYHVADFG
jgi:hypothetical protein